MFANTALGMCQKLLEDPEPRVRLAVGTCLAIMAEARGAGVWESTGRRITGSIRNHWVCTAYATSQLQMLHRVQSRTSTDFLESHSLLQLMLQTAPMSSSTE